MVINTTREKYRVPESMPKKAPSWCDCPEKVVGLLMSRVCGRKEDGAFIRLEGSHYGRCV